MNQCAVFARGCLYAGDDLTIRVSTTDAAGVDVTAATASTCWQRVGDSTPTIDLTDADPQVTISLGYVEIALGALDTAITPGFYDVWYAIEANGYTRRAKQRIEIVNPGCSA